MTRRRRPEKKTVPAPAPTMAELAAEATARVFAESAAPLAQLTQSLRAGPYRLGEGGKAPPPFAPVLCGWCQRREGPQCKREHTPCGFAGCACFCGERSHDVTQPIAALITETPGIDEHTRAALAKRGARRGEWGPNILENPELRRAVRDLDIAEKAANIFGTGGKDDPLLVAVAAHQRCDSEPDPALFDEDPREGSGVRDAVSQDPALAGLLEGL